MSADTRCAHPGAQLLSALCSGSSGDLAPKLRAGSPPGKLPSLSSSPQSGASNQQALQQLRADPSPPHPNPSCSTRSGSRPQGQLRLRGRPSVRTSPVPPSLPLPRRRALTDLRQAQLQEGESPHGAPPELAHGVGAERTEEEESERASERGWSVPARGAGEP